MSTGRERLDHAELVGHLGAAEHHRVRPGRVLREARQHVHLRGDQVAGVMRQQLRDVVHRGLLAVHDAEAVGDERPVGPGELGQRRQRFALRIVLAGLARIESDVLQQQHIAVGQPFGPGQRIRADDIAGQLHVAAQLLPSRAATGASDSWGRARPWDDPDGR